MATRNKGARWGAGVGVVVGGTGVFAGTDVVSGSGVTVVVQALSRKAASTSKEMNGRIVYN